MSAPSPSLNSTPSVILPGRNGRSDMRFFEFIALMAWLMALPAMTIDMMLAALPEIAREFTLLADNDRQLMITIYMLGFAFGQLFFGPVSDRFGRRPILFLGLGLYLIATLVVIFAPDYSWVLTGRCLQGLAAASPRILALAIVRDCSVGRGMSRIISFIMVVFIAVPIFAPLFGAVLMQWWNWRLIFWFMTLSAMTSVCWVAWRLPETLSEENRASLKPQYLWHTFKQLLKNRQVVGYSVALGFVFGCMLTYVGSAQQVFGELYGLGDKFALAFGAVAFVMAISSITNIRLVQRMGMRKLSHFGLLGFIVISLLYYLLGFPPKPPLWVLYIYLCSSFYLMCLSWPNFNAMAMEPMGQYAGLGSALMSCYTTIVGAVLGWWFGQAFDHTLQPMVSGFIMMSVATLIVVLITERGRLGHDQDDEKVQ